MPAPRPPRHRYDLPLSTRLLGLVLLATVPPRAAARACLRAGTLAATTPHPGTGRLWLLRLGLFRLNRPVPKAADWFWLVDHTALLGRHRLLVVLGLRQRPWAARARAGRGALSFADVRLLHLAAVADPDGPTIQGHLVALARRAGAPRSIVSDRGADVRAGIRLFTATRPGVAEVSACQHFVANRLKALLQATASWATFPTRLGQTRAALQQTEWAFVVPPALRTKSRYLNLDVLLRWAAKARALLELPAAERARRGGVVRLEQALGWVRDLDAPLAQWGEWLALREETVRAVRTCGLYAGAARRLGARLRLRARTESGRESARTLVAWVRAQQGQARRRERLVASTEVLEAVLGRYKALTREHSRGGVTALALGLAGLLGAPDSKETAAALAECSTADVRAWVAKNLAPNVQQQRGCLASLLPKRKKTATKKD